MNKHLRPLLTFSLLFIAGFTRLSAQTTYDFSTNASLSFGDAGFGIWYTQANITVDGVNYKLTASGNGSFTNQGSGGASNSKVLRKEGSGGDVFTIQRNDGQPFKFYGFWVKHQSMNSYAQFYSLPPFYTITYNKSDGSTETYSDNTAMQGGSYTTSSATFTKDLTVTSVTVNFQAIIYYWIDDIIVGPASLAPSFSAHPSNKNICHGSNTSFSATASNATSYQWQVNTGSGFGNITNSSPYSGATTSTLNITGATTAMNGYAYRCVATGSGSVNSNSATLTVKSVSTTGSQTNILCYGGATGSATVTPSGGTSPYTYSWSPSGGTAATATGLAAGTYTVTVTDNNSCQATRSYTIMQPAGALAATTSKTDVSCYGGSNGTAGVTASGGTAPYTYSWSPSGGTAATATGLAAGTYTVTITDNNSCQISKTITVGQPAAALSATTSKTDVSCYGGSNGTAGVTASGGTAPYTYSWSPSGGTAATATGLAAGTYTVTITDNNSCQISKTITVGQPAAALSATTSKTDVSCYGGSNGTAGVTASGGTAPYTYSWSPSGGTAATATGLAAGTYTVTITDNNSCQISKTITVGQPAAALSATTSKTDVSCYGGSNGTAGVTASGGTAPYTYSWSPSGGTAATATGLAAGTYTVTITDNNSCQISKTITVGQPAAALSATTSKTDVSCYGGSNGTAGVTASGGTAPYTYSWSPSGGTAATATGLAAGTYTVTITDNNSCQISKTITVGQPAIITTTATPASTNVCSGGATDIQLSSNTSGVSYAWTVSTLSGSVSGATASSGTSIAQTLTGNGQVKYTITASKSGCTGTSTSVTITVKPLTTIGGHPADKNIDEEQNTTFSITASDATGYQWQVDKGSGFIDIADIAPYSGATTSTLTITNATGDLDGYKYRCVASGDCSSGINSNAATLSVRVKATQTISINSTASATYGDADFAPSASTSSGLALVYSSSDENIVSIVNGKIHIKKAGQVTITASQGGDNDYKPATPVTQLLTIAKKNVALTFQSVPAITKTYDGTKTASLSTQNFSIEGLVNSDEVSATFTAEYADKSAGEGKSISITGLSLSGSDKENYNLTTTSGLASGSIARRDITLTISSAAVISKEYDATKNITIAPEFLILNNVINPDVLNVSGQALYADENAGSGKTISLSNLVLSGSDKDNYTLTTVTAQTTGEITPKEMLAKIVSTPAITKVYDGNNSADPTGQNYQLVGLEAGDDVSVSGTALYDDRNAGKGKIVTVENITLSGADKDNYLLANTSAVTVGSITPKKLTLTLEQVPLATKLYQVTKDAALNKVSYRIHGIIGHDDVKLKEPKPGSPMDKSGMPKGASVHELVLIGADAGNYALDINSLVNPPAGTIVKEKTALSQSGVNVADADAMKYTMKAWGVNHQTLYVKISSPVAQRVALVVYTEAGSPVLLQQKQLVAGVNMFTVQISSLARGVYVVGTKGKLGNATQKVRL